MTARGLVAAADSVREGSDGDVHGDGDGDGNVNGDGDAEGDHNGIIKQPKHHIPGQHHQHKPRNHHQQQHSPPQPTQDKLFNFNNPHAITDLVSICARARAALAGGASGCVTFEMESTGNVLMQVLPASHPLHSIVAALPAAVPPQATIAFMIMSSKRVPLMQSAYVATFPQWFCVTICKLPPEFFCNSLLRYLAAAVQFNAVFSAAKLAGVMCT